MKKISRLLILTITTCVFFTACIKNTDFDQAEDIVLSPVIELNLIYFNLDASDFYDAITSNPILTVRDTTEIKFLNDSTLHESLKRVEFYFQFTNSIPRDFQVDFQFLSERNDTAYFTQTYVDQGTLSTPVVTDFIENIEGDAIFDLTRANKVVVSVTIPSSIENLDGTLNLKSKAIYFLEN